MEEASKRAEGKGKEMEDPSPSDTATLMCRLLDALEKQVPGGKPGSPSRGNLLCPLHLHRGVNLSPGTRSA